MSLAPASTAPAAAQHAPGRTALPRRTLRRPALFPLGLTLTALLCISLLVQGWTAWCCGGLLWIANPVLAALSQGTGKPRIPFVLWLGGARTCGQGWSARPRGAIAVTRADTILCADDEAVHRARGSSKTPGTAAGLLVALPLMPIPSAGAGPSNAAVLGGVPPAGGCVLHSRSP